MYLDILGTGSFGQYNRFIARTFNLEVAVYLSEILAIMDKVYQKQKDKMDLDGFWKLDRKYLEKQTTLTTEQQTKCEQVLSVVGILTTKNKNEIRLDLPALFRLMLGELVFSDEQSTEIAKLLDTAQICSETKLTKKQAVAIGLKKCVNEPDEELKKLYYDWIDVAIQKYPMTKVSIENFISDVNAYTNDLDEKKKLIRRAVQTGWTVLDWLVDKKTNSAYQQQSTPQKVFTGKLDKSESF